MIAYKNLGIDEVLVLNNTGKSIPQTKSQLTDIFNKAKKTTTKEQKQIDKSVEGRATRLSGYVTKKDTTLLKNQIENVNRGARQGRKLLKDEIKTNQKALAEVIQKSGLEPKDRAKLVSILGKVQTDEQYKKALVKVNERIEVIEEQVNKRKAISSLRKTIKTVNVKKLRPEFKSEIENLLKGVDVKNTSENKLSSLKKTKEFLETHPDNVIPQSVINTLDKLNQKQLRDFTTEEIKQVDAIIKSVVKLNALKNKLIFGNKLKSQSQVIADAVERINSKTSTEVDGELVDDDIISSDEADKRLKKGFTDTVKNIVTVDSYGIEDIAEILDRTPQAYSLADNVDHIVSGEPTLRQPNSEVLYRGFNKGTTRALEVEQEMEEFLLDGLHKIAFTFDKKGEAWSNSFVKDSKGVKKKEIKLDNGKTLSVSSGQKISLYLHSLRKQSRKHLLNGGFAFEGDKTNINKLTSNDLLSINNSLTPQERIVANKINKFFNEFARDVINDTSVKLNGFEIAVEENYIPIRTNDIDRKIDSLKAGDNVTPSSMSAFYRVSLEGMGIFKETTNAQGSMIIEDVFNTVEKYKKQVSAYAGFAEPLRNAKALAYSPAFKIAVIDNYGEDYLGAVHDFIRDVEGSINNTINIEKLTTELINKLDVAILGLNPWVMAKQPVSFMLYNIEIDLKYLISGFNNFRKNKENTIKEMKLHSPQMKDRLKGNITREMGELANVGKVRQLWTGKTGASQKVMSGIKWADLQSVGSGWEAVKLEVSEQYPNLSTEDYWEVVAERHEYVTHRTQPTYNVKDKSKTARSKSVIVRLLTKYTTIRNRMFRRIRTQILRYSISEKKTGDKIVLAKNLSLLTFVSSMLIAGIDEARNRFVRGKKSTLLEFLVRTLSSSLSLVYYVGDGFSAIVSKIQQGTFAGFGINNPISSLVDTGLNFLAELYLTIEQASNNEKYKSGDKKGEEKWKTSILRMVDDAIDVFTRAKGIPLSNVESIFKGIIQQTKEEEKKRITF